MISVYSIKPKFQQLLRPVLVALHGMGVTANALTLTAIALSAATGLVFWLSDSRYIFLMVPLVLLIRMALNALDGMMARTYNMQSRLGEILNEMGDVVSDIFLFFPFVKVSFLNTYLLFAFILLAVVNEFAGILSKAMGRERRYDGPMGKSDRALFVGLGCVLMFFFPVSVQEYGNYGLILAIILLIISTFTRLKKAL